MQAKDSEDKKKEGIENQNTRFDGKIANPNCSNFPCVEKFLHLCPGFVEINFVGRFIRTIGVTGWDAFCIESHSQSSVGLRGQKDVKKERVPS